MRGCYFVIVERRKHHWQAVRGQDCRYIACSAANHGVGRRPFCCSHGIDKYLAPVHLVEPNRFCRQSGRFPEVPAIVRNMSAVVSDMCSQV
jgi:hypothetical protein